MRIETEPCLEFANEAGVGHLRAVAGGDELAQPVDAGTVGQQDEVDPGNGSGAGKQVEIARADRAAVIVGAGRLAMGNGIEQGRG